MRSEGFGKHIRTFGWLPHDGEIYFAFCEHVDDLPPVALPQIDGDGGIAGLKTREHMGDDVFGSRDEANRHPAPVKPFRAIRV